MALGDQAGKAAADTLASAGEKVADTIGADAADAVSDVTGAIDRFTQALERQAESAKAESVAWRASADRLNGNIETLVSLLRRVNGSTVTVALGRETQ